MSLKYTAHLLVLIEPVLQYLCRHFVETRSLQRWRFTVIARVLNDERARINRVVTVFRTSVLSQNRPTLYSCSDQQTAPSSMPFSKLLFFFYVLTWTCKCLAKCQRGKILASVEFVRRIGPSLSQWAGSSCRSVLAARRVSSASSARRHDAHAQTRKIRRCCREPWPTRNSVMIALYSYVRRLIDTLFILTDTITRVQTYRNSLGQVKLQTIILS